ncbi:MAG: YggS family pyridoxal phosphate-dependent enzyme [Gammaproteobacteria bacterium]|nr:YggS family pyridoxal phosphate-dependent enzyme [Pseudomonadales bacterium]
MRRIADNISEILERIHAFEKSYQRPEGAVTLLAVSKTQPAEAIRQAYAAGIRDFGENYLQEAEAKIAALSDLDLTWHFIGPIQSNKTRLLARHFHWVHSVDRLKVARRLSEQREDSQAPLNICVQVNLSGEDSKSGISLADTESFCQQVATLPRLQLRGLMSIPAAESDFGRQRQQFARLATEFKRLRSQFAGFDTLSMGMSGDYEAAIAEGATLIRIGTAVFGARI